MSLNTFNFSEVSVIAGVTALSGFAEGSAITVVRDVESFTTQVGADGEVTRSRTSNKKGTVTIVLQQGSASNDILSGLIINDENTGNGSFPLTIKDNSGRTVAFSKDSYLRKPADVALSRDAGERTWEIDCAVLELFVGGN